MTESQGTFVLSALWLLLSFTARDFSGGLAVFFAFVATYLAIVGLVQIVQEARKR